VHLDLTTSAADRERQYYECDAWIGYLCERQTAKGIEVLYTASDIGGEFTVRYFPATDLEHQSLDEIPPRPDEKEVAQQEDPIANLYTKLNRFLRKIQADDGPNQEPQHPAWEKIYREIVPRSEYPGKWSQKDCQRFSGYWEDIKALRVTPNPPAGTHPNYSPTLLSASQNIYDAEATRRESINTRCTAILSTAGILGTLVVAASQLGLIQQGGSLKPFAWVVYVFFVVSLLYLIWSIVVALRVHGGIQGEAVDARDLHLSDTIQPLDQYNCNMAKINLLYGTFNWCLNNKFKDLLHSAHVCLRNGLIAIIIAGALSPWLLTK
jgi:hypothetical protein